MRTKPPMIAAALRRREALLKANRQIARAGFAFLARSLQQISTLVMTLLAGRYLLPGEYGVYSLGILFIILIQTLTYTGFYQFILTSKEEDSLVLSTCFWLILGLVSLASLLLAGAAWPLEWVFDAPDLGLVLLFLAVTQPLASVGAWSSAALLRRGQAMLNFRIMFAQNLAALVGGAALLWLWHSIFALVAFRAIRVVSGAILYAVLGRDCPRFLYSRALASKAMAFSASLYASRFLSFLSQYAADLLLGIFHSTTQVGLYRFGNRMATAVTDAATQPMSNFAAMQFGAAARAERDMAGVLARFTGTIALLTGFLGALIVVFARDAVVTFFNPSYAAGLLVTYAMALRALAGSGKLLLEPAFAALGRTQWVMFFNLATSVVAVATVFATSPWGLEVLAWAQVAVTLGSTLFAFYLLHRHGRVAIAGCLRNLALALVLSLLFGVCVEGLRSEVLPHVALPFAQGVPFAVLAAGLLALPFLALAIRLRVFCLDVFSG
ncbi:oligosaccharide flippase family protein [Novosphingobium sp. 1949]|uniref:Oligosaccharide flippase family protein n=1 Tax=Novosphingobium organovorum TaxID=2930092 RepID=A0ABT0BEM6_9SPHN|nr:oligosaccharide flippase family protein [Novosphingobium organovorum]MCJ2183523.1 oligosaccharide flippase family protein [Novosphingobium organovorum]